MKYGKIYLGNGVEFLTGKQMKSTRGSYGYGDGDDDWGTPIELPEVTITCGQNSGQCWKCFPVFKGEFTGFCKIFTGKQNDFCHELRDCDSF